MAFTSNRSDDLKTQFASASEADLYMLFTEKQWTNMSEQRRLDALQEVECRMAARQGRKACRILLRYDMGPGSMGAFDGNDIVLNASLLKASKSRFGRKASAQVVAALDTVIHEGRHAFQRAAVTGKATQQVAAQKRREWLVNMLSYAGTNGNFAMYAFQPIERDAREFAAREMSEIYRKIKKATGKSDRFFEEGLNAMRTEKTLEYLLARELKPEQIKERLDGVCSRILDCMKYTSAILECMGEKVTLAECLSICGVDKENIDEALDAQIADYQDILSGKKRLDSYMDGLDAPDICSTIDKTIDLMKTDTLDQIAARIREKAALGSAKVDGAQSKPEGRIKI